MKYGLVNYIVFACPESKARAQDCAQVQEQDRQKRDVIVTIILSYLWISRNKHFCLSSLGILETAGNAPAVSSNQDIPKDAHKVSLDLVRSAGTDRE